MPGLPVCVMTTGVFPHAGTPGGGRDIVGDDWVMTDINGADAPIAQTGALPLSVSPE